MKILRSALGSIGMLSASLLISALTAGLGSAQARIPLTLDRNSPAFLWEALFCDKNSGCGVLASEASKETSLGKTSIRVRIRRNGSNFLVSSRNDDIKGLGWATERVLFAGNSVRIDVGLRMTPEGLLHLPFEISHEAVEKNGQQKDNFRIRAYYAATGVFEIGDCSVPLSLVDINHDMAFTLTDAARGTNLRLDLNKDGRVWGKDEFRSTNEILEICGGRFIVSELNDSGIVFATTDLVLAKVGAAVPAFEFKLQNARTISPERLIGTVYVLDFWASWCTPCVDNLPELKLLADSSKIRMFSVNVDDPNMKTRVDEITKRYGIADSSSIRGLGERDPLWKMFGGANLNRMSIPLYVLIDSEGIVRYAGNGGTRLSELQRAISTVTRE